MTRTPRRTVVEVTDPAALATASPAPTTLGELRSGGATYRPVKAELRANLIARLGRGEPTLPGMVGFEDTVLPEVERALIAGHDLVLLGERGQGKTRLIRTLVGLLDEWTPVLAGSELNETRCTPSRSGRIGRSPSTATRPRWAGCTAATGSARSSRRRTPASAT